MKPPAGLATAGAFFIVYLSNNCLYEMFRTTNFIVERESKGKTSVRKAFIGV
jgi:hypothetical protein